MVCLDGTFCKKYVYDEAGTKRLHTEYFNREGKLQRKE